MIITKLEQYDLQEQQQFAVVMLLISFVMLLLINILQRWSSRKEEEWRQYENKSNSQTSLDESKVVKYLLIGTAVSFLMIMLVVPLITIFAEAFRKGSRGLFHLFEDEYVFQAIKLTLITAVIAVPLNLVFGVCASWAIAKYSFFGKSFF